MTALIYCIKHEEMVYPEKPLFGHPVFVRTNHGTEIEFCEFEHGWATTPPPEFDMDAWIDSIGYYVEPDPELEFEPSDLDMYEFYLTEMFGDFDE